MIEHTCEGHITRNSRDRAMQYPTVRTTLDKIGEAVLPTPAVYILAYMKQIIYVGKAEESVEGRLTSHMTNAMGSSEQLGKWLIKNADRSNTRLDILVAPNDAPENWAKEIEAKCIRQFRPLLNEALNTRSAKHWKELARKHEESANGYARMNYKLEAINADLLDALERFLERDAHHVLVYGESFYANEISNARFVIHKVEETQSNAS